MSSSMATPVGLEDFLANPDIHYYDLHELHNGEIVEVSPPTNQHVDIQIRLEALFRSLIGGKYTILREFYYTLPTEGRRADVAVVLESRRKEQLRKPFFGSPEIVIEILSDSNKAADLGHLRRTCLADNSDQFWIVDPFEKVVEVYHRNGTWKEYRFHQMIEFHFADKDMQVPVSSIF